MVGCPVGSQGNIIERSVLMAAAKILSSYQKGDHEQIRVLTSTYKDKESIHIRSFYNTEADSEWKFGKGVAIPADDSEGIDSVIEGLQKAKEYLEKG
jgi:hypothetical protein